MTVFDSYNGGRVAAAMEVAAQGIARAGTALERMAATYQRAVALAERSVKVAEDAAAALREETPRADNDS